MRFLAIGLFALAAPAFAQTGVYADLTAGRTSVSSKYVDDSNDISFGGAIGYQLNTNLGIEIYTRSLSMNPFRGLLTEAGYYPDRHYGVAVRGTAPLGNKFSAYGRLGVGRTTMKSNRTSLADKRETDPAIGVGVRYDFNKTVAAELEATRLTKSDATLITAGVRFQF